MSLRVVVRSPAETDLLESALFIAEDSPAAAQRFLDEAEKAFARLPCGLRPQTPYALAHGGPMIPTPRVPVSI